MKEITSQIVSWQEAGEAVAVATLVRVAGSAPRRPGARLLLNGSGAFVGSVSGGCVESALIQEVEMMLGDERPRLRHYGISDALGWEVGLACGGQLDVFIQPAAAPLWRQLDQLVAGRTPCVLLTAIGGEQDIGAQAIVTAGSPAPDFPYPEAVDLARASLQDSTAQATVLACSVPAGEVFVEPLLPPYRLVIVGGVHAAMPLARHARWLDFEVSIVDPRRRFASHERFPEVAQIVNEWPDRALESLALDGRTAIAVLTHDPKIDEPALRAALASDVFYIGAIGSRKTSAERYRRMAEGGVPPAELDRVHGPIGLDLGGRSAEELALSVLAEIVAVRNGRRGGFMVTRP